MSKINQINRINIIPSFEKKFYLFPYFLLSLIGCVLYGSAIEFDYVWDDKFLLIENTILREERFGWDSILRPIIEGSSYFRPLVMLTWFLEMRFFNLKPAYSHGINISIYVLNCCILYAIADKVFKKNAIIGKINNRAFCATLFYAAHPCLVENVAWVSGRFDLLATTFILAACLLTMCSFSVKKFLLFGFFSLAALSSKETGLLLPFILILFNFACFPHENLIFFVKKLSPYLLMSVVVILVYFIFRKLALDVVYYNEFGLSAIFRAIASGVWIRKISFYLFMALLPFFDLMPQHDWRIELASWRQSYAGLTAALFLLGISCFFALKRHVWAIFGMGFFLGISFVIGIVEIHIGDTIGAERFLCLSLAMLGLSIVSIYDVFNEKFQKIKKLNVIAGLFFLGIFSISVFSTYNYKYFWRNGILLWGLQYEITPYNDLTQHSYLVELAALKTPENKEKFLSLIDKIRETHEGKIPRSMQTIYANFLFDERDPEALPYYEGVRDSHLILSPGSGASNLIKKFQGRVTFYNAVNYMKAVLVFKGDLEKVSLLLQEIENNYVERGFESKLISVKLILDYLLKGHQEAIRAKKEYISLLEADEDGFDKIKNEARGLIFEYCEVKKEVDDCYGYADSFVHSIFEEDKINNE